MAYIISPTDYKLNDDGRLLYYDIAKKKYIKRHLIKKNEIIEISNKGILNNVLNFKFRFQRYEDGKWINVGDFFFLEEARYIRQIFLDEYEVSQEKMKEIINFFSKDKFNKNYNLAKIAFKKAVVYINNNDNNKFANIRKYLKIIDSNEFEITPLWANISVYLKFIIRRKEFFDKLNLKNTSFFYLLDKYIENSEFQQFISKELELLSNYELEFAYLLKGIYYSFTQDRKRAEQEFVLAAKGDLIKDFGIGQGIYTYVSEINDELSYENEIFFVDNDYEERDLTIVVSMDQNFLRKYGPQLFYSIIALKKYHFHFHIVANYDEAVDIIDEAKDLYTNMLSFFQTTLTVNSPTFSHESCPKYVSNPVTLYACARFLNAQRFIDKFNSKLLIIDADFYINNDFEKFLDKVEITDVSMSIVWGAKSMQPWTRFMAGNLFINNNQIAKRFLHLLSNYIMHNLHSKNSWTLDQNALTYAIEKTILEYPKFKIGNAYKYPRPLTQPPIRRFVEE